ncbi:hypothetical protein DWB61_17330 [Ancylomarina euxinus]|uniref:Uncharacterized protein n=1 Tax=Ancylomarina euxinus TaxID=2283627 RepID=A0A425XWK2_9BACT|nr:hypothetical protein [Ancylomarina euxinus]MCZ4696423.1 hypothetical protein [Ancylomarina euxinus]MUP16806.1 hypothetical protein [Ancylomarina euxinus]RRG19004.1 hypothetical protein DWB61_17330 [Ancylomarina euxinus]
MNVLPQIIDNKIDVKTDFPLLVEREIDYINEAKGLFESGFYSYSLLAIWNGAVNNLKRKVEAYGVELWSSVVKDESGRKKYDKDGETIAERWSNVDDLVLIAGATRLGLLNPKAGKSLEMINWMRNHASPAHDSDNRVEMEDAVGLILLLQKNLFEQPFPDPGHSVSAIFEPIKNKAHTPEELSVLKDQIASYRNQDIRNVFGFFMDLVTKGEEPAKSNVFELFSVVWEKSGEDLRKALGVKYHTYVIDPDSDDSSDKGAKTRVFELLIVLNAVNYIPDGTRARIYRRAAEKLAEAKNTSYGWSVEESASKNLLQLGTFVPSVAFEELYQEILAIWCGNYWGRSDGYLSLKPFIETLNTDRIRTVLRMFRDNERVQEELSQSKPYKKAVALLKTFEDKLTLEAHKQELKETIEYLDDL